MKSTSRMMDLKKIASIFISIVMVASMLLSVTMVSFAGTFSDLNDSPYEPAVEKLADKAIINGYSDGTFKPENNISRAEACAIVVKAMNPGTVKLNDAVDQEYTDITDSDYWAFNYINYASAMGVVNGYNDGSFRPTANVSYDEFAAMLIRGCGIKAEEVTGNWPENYRNAASEKGLYSEALKIYNEDTTDEFDYSAPATRGNAALMVSAVLEMLGEYGETALPDEYSKKHIYNDGRYEWIDGAVVQLSLLKAISTMQTEGALANTAASNKASDQAKLVKYGENIEAIDDGIQEIKDKKAELQETLKTINETLAKKKLLLLAALVTGKYSDTKAQLEEAEESIPTIEEGIEELDKQLPELEFNRTLAVQQRDFCEANIDNNNKAELNSIESQAVSVYYGVLQARENLKVNEDNLEVQNDLMDIVNLKYKVGTVAKIEVKSQESAVIQAEQSVKEAKSALEKATMNFNLLLGNDITANLELTDELAVVAFPEKSVEDYIKEAKDNRLTVLSVNYGLEMAEQNLQHLNENDTDKTSSDYLTAQNTVNTLNNSKTLLLKNLEVEVRSAYVDMLNKYDAVKSAEKTLDLAKNGYDVKLLMYENGLATMTDVREAQVYVYQANQLVMANIASYNIAVNEFYFMTGIGTERIEL